jgi:hypothetical protein
MDDRYGGHKIMHGNGSLWGIQRSDRARSPAQDLSSAVLSNLINPIIADSSSQPAGTTKPRAEMEGFRHFLKVPTEAQRFTIDGAPFDPEKMWGRADELMQKLVQRIEREPRIDDRGIPSGYTYFLQLVAHDIVHSTIMVSRNAGCTFGLANARRSPLRLETIYGGGPTECPSAYDRNPGSFRKRLRLGRINGGADSRQDIARARAETDEPESGYSEPLVSDPRNDSHAILSQMVTLAHQVHNGIVGLIESVTGNTKESDFVRDQHTFVAAQAALIMIYRNRIRDDLLRRILHPAVASAYKHGSVPILDKDAGSERGYWLAPLEFTHGFFRFAHSMIRNKYTLSPGAEFDLSQILHQNSEMSPNAMPFQPPWAIKWKHFFSEEPTNGNNFSVRIGPWSGMASGDALGKPALWHRDLVSSILVRPWSIASLIDEIRPSHGELLDKSKLLKHATSANRTWTPDLEAWLREFPADMSSADVKTLANDPPIPFFVRYEAYRESKGRHLGILGSIVVADIFYSILQRDSIMGIQCSGPLARQLGKLSSLMFDRDDVFAKVSDPLALDAFIASLGNDTGFPVGSAPA